MLPGCSCVSLKHATLALMEKVTNVKITKSEATCEAEIKGEITAAALDEAFNAALKDVQKTAKVDGFRPGHAPLERILSIYGEPMILERAAERAIQDALPEILAKENLLVIAAPRVMSEKPQKGASLPFTAHAPLSPTVTLPDYKAIAEKSRSKKEEAVVSDDEHAEALMHLRREKVRIDKIESGIDPQKAGEEAKALADADVPELDEMFVQTLGYPSLDEFAAALHENIKNEKDIRAREKVRTEILDELIKNAQISYPALLKNYELDDMQARLEEDLSRMSMTLDQYLAQIKKTREELRASWDESADKRAKVRLILNEIARAEKIEPGHEELAHEIEHAKEHYKDIDLDTMRTHIAHAMRNEMTLRFLEGNTEKVGHTAASHSEHEH